MKKSLFAWVLAAGMVLQPGLGAMALETAARINAQVEEMETICEHTMAPGTKAIVYAGLYRTTGDKIADFTVQGYSENGFTYYVSK